MKSCVQCGKTQNINQFYIDLRHKDKHHSWCKQCCKARRAAGQAEPNQRLIDTIADHLRGRQGCWVAWDDLLVQFQCDVDERSLLKALRLVKAKEDEMDGHSVWFIPKPKA